MSYFCRMSWWVLVGSICVAAPAHAVELTGLRTSQAALQARLRARQDCLAWYRFGKVPKALTFLPAPEQDRLGETAGSFDGQRATRIFHGRMKGALLDIPESGFTLCCWLKVHKLEEVDRGGYKRTVGGVMASGSGYYNGWRLMVSPHSSTLKFALGRPEGSRNISSSGFFTVGEWHHAAVTWDHKTLALWIDGVSRAETTTSMSYNPAATLKYFRIGECSQGTGVLDFEIADLGFFSKALPAELFEGLGNPDAMLERKLAAFLQEIPPPPGDGSARAERGRVYRKRFEPLLTLTGCEDSRAFRQARSYARLLVAKSFLRTGMREEAKKAFRQLAEDNSAMLVHRARAMLGLGDMLREERKYTAARREYRKMRAFFVAKHEAFRVEAMARLRDIGALADGEPFRNERQRRIDRIEGATAWFHVSPGSDDGNPGTVARPFRTLERARDALRERRKKEPLPPGGAAIVLQGGVYPRLKESFTLAAEDSGTAEAPIVYRAADGEQAVLRGGRTITGFAPLADSAVARRIPEAARSHLLQADLRAAGISDFGQLRPRGRGLGKLAGMDEPAHMELFFNRVPMSLARWPNDTPKMSERFAHVELGDQKTVRDGGRTITRDSDVFYYSNPRQDAWADEPDPWLFGYWQRAYFSSYRKILHIDREKNEIQVDWNQSPTTKRRAEMVEGSGYQGINLLCELDSPGEWYLDRDTGLLYFWPPAPIKRAEVLVSILEAPIIATEGLSNAVFRGLILEAGRQHGVVVNEGENVLLAGCVIRDMGCKAAQIMDGRGHALVGCDLAHLGDAGVKLTGGDLPTLRSSEHVVENCHIHHFAHWNRGAYQPGIEVVGVGVRMSHCLIHDAPHQAFLLSGNDHLTEYCEIHDVTHEAGDAGAWYMYGGSGAALSERGQVVRYNYWHDLPYNETFKKYHCVCHMGVYIDNVNGGVTVYGNLFSRFDGPNGAVFFGGSDDIIENNVFHRCFTGINLSDRSWVYAKAYKSIDAFLTKMKVNEPPWSVRYPRLTAIKPHTEDLTLIVRGNVAARNIALDCGKFIYGSTVTMRYARIEQNWNEGDPGFKDPDNGDFHLRPDSPVFVTCGFEPLPLDKMGLYNDELRASWPVHHESGVYETLLVDDAIVRKRAAEMPVCQVPQRTAPITIDGRLDPAEWDGLDKARATVLNRTPSNKPTKARPSYIWLRRDEEYLYIALAHELNPGETPRPKAGSETSWWKGLDMAEIIFEGPWGKNARGWWPKDKGHGPLFYLVGDSAGRFDSIAIADLPASRAEGLRSAVQYAAAAEPGRWTAEWRIPLAAICLDPSKAKSCCFNVGVLKPGTRPGPGGKEKLTPGEIWAVWRGTKGANWKVWNAGLLYLRTPGK